MDNDTVRMHGSKMQNIIDLNEEEKRKNETVHDEQKWCVWRGRECN